MDSGTVLEAVKSLLDGGGDIDAADKKAFDRIIYIPHITTHQAILIAKRLLKYSSRLTCDIEALKKFASRPVSDAPLISVMRYEDKYGPRIGLHMPYNKTAQEALKHALPFPRSKFEGGMKVWSIMDDEEVIKTAVSILKEHGYDFSPWLLTEEGDGSQGYLLSQSSPTDSPSSTVFKKSGCSASLERGKLILRWPFIPEPELRDGVRLKVKSIPGRKFDFDEKYWTIPIAHGHTLFKELDGYYQPLADVIASVPEVEEYLEGALKRVALSQASELDDGAMKDSIQKRLASVFTQDKELYPFQYAGVAFVELAEGRCLIGDDMGLGKTPMSLAYAALHREQWPVVVVCPANVKYNWEKEIHSWIPDATCSVVKDGKDIIQNTDFVIINFDLMNKRVDDLLVINANMCIIDESHYLKNSKAKRTAATLCLAKTCDAVICLSGTAITNRPIEFYTTLNLLRPEQFGSFYNFAQTYTNAYHNGYGWDFSGASNTKQLNERTRDFCIRRLKTEVLKELPPKTRSFLPVSISFSEKKEYMQSRLDWVRQYERYQSSGGMPPGFVLNMLTDLRHVCGLMKVAFAANWVQEYIEMTGKPVVIFAHHRDVIAGLSEHLDNEGWENQYRCITGSTNSETRQKNVDDFQDGEFKILICNTIAAKEGITLTAADTVLFIEREWVPGWEEQAEDRVLRIGQESDNVHAIYLSCAGTIDEHFDRIIEEKRAIVSSVLDGGDEIERAGIVSALLKKMEECEGFPPAGEGEQ